MPSPRTRRRGRARPPAAAARALGAVAALDEVVSGQLLRTDRAGLDRTMRLLSTSADHSKIWAVAAGAMALSGQPDLRRGAALGLGSAALSSLVVNQGLKRMLPRHRPTQESIAVRRRLHRVPSSSSFPSGHAASAAAFATGAALRAPLSLGVLGPLATAVACSRAYTGVHFASDVVAGAAVGAAIAVVTERRIERWAALRPDAAC